MTMPRETAEFLVDQAISNLNNGLTKECRERILKAFIALAECIAEEKAGEMLRKFADSFDELLLRRVEKALCELGID